MGVIIVIVDCIIAYSCCVISHKYSIIEEGIAITQKKLLNTQLNIQQQTDEVNINNMNKYVTDMDSIIIAVDFDNTLAVTKYPTIIKPIDLTCELIRKAKKNGAIIILWTCREGKELEEAVNWCKENNVPIDYINENVPERIEKWGNDCRKIGADIYIDDRSINPLRLKQMKG